jgi:hypothetical protein
MSRFRAGHAQESGCWTSRSLISSTLRSQCEGMVHEFSTWKYLTGGGYSITDESLPAHGRYALAVLAWSQ